MIAPATLIVIDSPEATGRTFDISATGRPAPIRGVTRPVATRCTDGWSARRSSTRRYPFVEECLWWVRLALTDSPLWVDRRLGDQRARSQPASGAALGAQEAPVALARAAFWRRRPNAARIANTAASRITPSSTA